MGGVRYAVILSLLALSQCHFGVGDVASVPATPTWTDVEPILHDHCVLCHGSPSNRGSPSFFRLDVYDDDPNGTYVGAATMANDLMDRVNRNNMPPAAAWGDGVPSNAKQVLQLWVNQGAR